MQTKFSKKYLGRAFVLTFCLTLLFSVLASNANAVVTPQTSDNDGANALASALSSTLSTGNASFVENPGGNTTAIGDSRVNRFPTVGGKFIILSSGNAANTVPNPSTPGGNPTVPGLNARGGYETTVLAVPITVAQGQTCLSFDFADFSDENSGYDEGLVAELDTNNWSFDNANQNLVAPNNFAVDANGKPYTPKSNDALFTSANQFGTSRTRGTTLLTARTPVTEGSHTLYLSISDFRDNVADSAALVSNLRTSATDCTGASAQPVTYTLDNAQNTGATTAYATKPHTTTTVLKNQDGQLLENQKVTVNVTGANPTTATVTTDANGKATFTQTGTNAGVDRTSFTFDDGSGTDAEAVSGFTDFEYLALPVATFSGTGDDTVFEGDSGTTDLKSQITLSEPAIDTTTFDYKVVGGDADSNDFVATTGTVTIAQGQTDAEAVLKVKGDTTFEDDESVAIQLLNPVNATIASPDSISQVIRNDDQAPVPPDTIEPNNPSDPTTPEASLPVVSIQEKSVVNEGDKSTKNAPVLISLSKASQKPVTVSYQTENGTAKLGSDYEFVKKTAVLQPGRTSILVYIPIKGDKKFEKSENFNVLLTGAQGATVADGKAAVSTVTIKNNDKKASACMSNRKFVIHLRPTDRALTSAKVTLNGKKVKAKKNKKGRYSATIDLRKFEKGEKAVVRITTKSRSGKTFKETRTYRPCA